MLFDAVADAVAGNAHIDRALIMFAIFGSITVIQQVSNGLDYFTTGVIRQRALGRMKQLINYKSSRIEPISFEDTEKLDDINKAQKGAENVYWFSFVVTILFTFYLPYFTFVAVYLFSINKLLVISIVLAFIPSMASQLVKSRVLADMEEKIAPVRRECEFYEQAACGYKYFKETRLLRAFSYFSKLLKDSITRFNKKSRQARGRAEAINLLLSLLTLITFGGVLFLLVFLLIRGEISVGAFAAIYYSLDTMFIIMEDIVVNFVGSLSDTYGTICNFIRFINMPETGGVVREYDKSTGITVKNVYFSYPASKKYALKNVSLNIEPGETIALVGRNGSGKTTLGSSIKFTNHSPFHIKYIPINSLVHKEFD
jgi:ATP-binding cassette subfamily B protein